MRIPARFEAIRLDPTERVTVVLSSDYDALLAARSDLQDRYNRLRCRWAEEPLHDDHCEQEGGDPSCGCRVRNHRHFEAEDQAEVERLAEQLRIAREALRQIARRTQPPAASERISARVRTLALAALNELHAEE